MLFDLRSRGRRRTVQVVYIGLAVLIGAGLILFGVGTGSGGGGLFGAFTGSNSSSGGGNAVTSQVKKAVATTKKSPNSAAAWANLINARFSAAGSLVASNGTYTTAGKQQLALLTQDYSHYTALTKSPDVNTATIAAKAYTQLGDWSKSSAVYQSMLQAAPGNILDLRCVALTSYAAKNNRVAQLAQARLFAKLPKAAQAQYKTLFQEAKSSTAVVTESC